MSALHPSQRNLLERTITSAREEAERAARAALSRLAVNQEEAFSALSPDDRALRVKLRAEARRLGNFEALVMECAYEQWHRMLFARFLAENRLLMHPTGVPVTLRDCAELAPEEAEPDAWMLAARYASIMLPGIFRVDDPVLLVRFAPEGRQALERLLDGLPAEVFTAEDSLGWVYQFWQARQKEAVNQSGRKIGGADIAPVTQLFTEPYMVQFLLHNSLGAWWAARAPTPPAPLPHAVGEGGEGCPDSLPLPHAVATHAPHPLPPPPRCGGGEEGLAYLRRNEDGTPAAGSFEGWPSRAADLKLLDPCCGSGHFLVTALGLLCRMRMAEEGLGEAEAADAVLRDNLFGLEINARCTQIAAFNLALAAWKIGGYRKLPVPNIACTGLQVGGRVYEWVQLANGDRDMEATLRRLYHLFEQAPDLGSLIDPARMTQEENLFAFDWAQIAPLLERALAKEKGDDPAAAVFGVAAQGAARAADLLSGTYHLVCTNVPYLARGKQGDILREYIGKFHDTAKADLATAFVERCLTLCTPGGSAALVTPQNWLFLGSYRRLRERLLKEKTWNAVAKLGENGFNSPQAAGAFTALFVLTNAPSAPTPCPLPHAVGEGVEGVATLESLSSLHHAVGEEVKESVLLMASREHLQPQPQPHAEEEGGRMPRVSRELIAIARELRQKATSAEQLLWQLLRKKQLHGRQFRRQHPIVRFVADFFCDDARLIVEIDGAVHNEPSQQERDREREAILRTYNYAILRFTNNEVLHDTERVLQSLSDYVLTHTHSFAQPSLPASPSHNDTDSALLSQTMEEDTTPQNQQPTLPPPPAPLPLSEGEGGRGGGGGFLGLDASAPRVPAEKAELLRRAPVRIVSQSAQFHNPDARIALEASATDGLLEKYASAYQGIKTGDDERHRRQFWEFSAIEKRWRFYQSTVEETVLYGGCEHIINWHEYGRNMARRQGVGAWDKRGVAVSQMRHLPVALYVGNIFDSNMSAVVPHDPAHLTAIWVFCASTEFHAAVRRIDQALKVTNASLVKVPFDLEHWQKIAAEKYPNGLPEPHSDDPTQWLFHGHPARSTEPLQVAVARLMGYHWPEHGLPPTPSSRTRQEEDSLDRFAEANGIVCLPAVAGEPPAAERLRALLAAAYGAEWTPALQERLLTDAGFAGRGLDEWLRDGFFVQHCRLFHNRPFLWHVWDGRRDGFSALVNYHMLDRRKLERLAFTYLGAWITVQREADRRGEPGANARLIAALALNEKLQAILQGEPPYDIYVRWKPLHRQPIGWEPDLNDGVRLNIRPFVTAEVLRSRFSIHWNKDRGADPAPNCSGTTERLNDLHITRVEKEAARRRAEESL